MMCEVSGVGVLISVLCTTNKVVLSQLDTEVGGYGKLDYGIERLNGHNYSSGRRVLSCICRGKIYGKSLEVARLHLPLAQQS